MISTSKKLTSPIDYLPGVGPQRAHLLKKELFIFTYQDLINHLPFRHVDKSKFHKVIEITPESGNVQIKGQIVSMQEEGMKRKKRLRAVLRDDSGKMELIWFKGISYVKQQFKIGDTLVVFGKPNFYKGNATIAHPEIEHPNAPGDKKYGHLEPVYSSTEKLNAKGLHAKGIAKLVKSALKEAYQDIEDFIPPSYVSKYQLLPLKEAYKQAHFPDSITHFQKALFTLKFAELLLIQILLVERKVAQTKKLKGFNFESIGENFNTFFNEKLPFPLTGAQKRVVKEIRRDMGTGAHMNRLLQGDVGAGKTIVALLSMLIALDNGFQAVMMAPTEILATQHYKGVIELLDDMFVEVKLLTGSTKQAERRLIHEGLENGNVKIIIGTHALLEDKVKFNNLGLCVIDEQHRFGVKQRARLWKKNTLPPHILVMTATPIPRTLAMTLYGDLDVSVIDELPPGRKPVKTLHQRETNRLKIFKFMEDEIKKGRQVYVVYPLIEESSTMDYKDLMDGYNSILRRFPRPDYQISIVHGRMKAEDKEYEMQRFVKGETQIMVATTVIEVGVNVPNASVMVIESSERFGLSQLHQLRGRVGRGADQSYCVLMTGDKLSNDARTRMEAMVSTNDGFKISEVDLQLRGPGDMMGTQQSGVMDLKVSDLAKDQQILELARRSAIEILEKDVLLNAPEHQQLKLAYQQLMSEKPNWGRIS